MSTQKKKAWNEHALPIALAVTLIEGLSGVGCSVAFLLFNQCVFKINNLSHGTTQGETVAFIFYSSYVTTGECKWADSDDFTQVINSNNLTKPNVVFIWQTVYLVLYIAWLMSSSLLLFSRRLSSLSPWVIMTSVIILTDLVNSSIILTDFTVDTSDISYSIQEEDRMWSICAMLMWSWRAGLIWFLNIFVLYAVVDRVKGTKVVEPVKYWTSKKFEDIRRELSTAPNQTQAEQYQHERQFNPYRETQFQTPQNHHQEFESAPRQQSLSIDEVPVHQHSAQLPDVHQAQQYQRQLSDLEDDGSNVYEAEPGRPHHLYQAVHKHDEAPRQQQAGLQARAQDQFQPRGEPIYQRPMSFKDKVRQASFNNQRSVGGMFSYAAPAGNMKRDTAVAPDQDVETAFNFLSKYEDSGSKASSSVHVNRLGYTQHPQYPSNNNLSRQVEDRRPGPDSQRPAEDGHFQIPRAKVQVGLTRSSSLLKRQEDSKLKDYETRYFVPLKQ